MKNINKTKIATGDWEQLNKEIYNLRKLLSDMPFYSGSGTPENNVGAELGAFYPDLTNGNMYIKKGGDKTKGGWEMLNVPSGMIMAYAGSSVPDGWLDCDGSAINRTVYASLFTAIGITWGAGDSSTTFNVPDLRAATLRGVGTSTIFTSNDAVTLAQTINDKFQGHRQDITFNGKILCANDGGQTTYGVSLGVAGLESNYFRTNTFINDGVNGNPRTGTETTGKARGVYWIIKI